MRKPIVFRGNPRKRLVNMPSVTSMSSENDVSVVSPQSENSQSLVDTTVNNALSVNNKVSQIGGSKNITKKRIRKNKTQENGNSVQLHMVELDELMVVDESLQNLCDELLKD